MANTALTRIFGMSSYLTSCRFDRCSASNNDVIICGSSSYASRSPVLLLIASTFPSRMRMVAGSGLWYESGPGLISMPPSSSR